VTLNTTRTATQATVLSCLRYFFLLRIASSDLKCIASRILKISRETPHSLEDHITSRDHDHAHFEG